MKTTIVAASISLMGTLALLITSASEAQQPATNKSYESNAAWARCRRTARCP